MWTIVYEQCSAEKGMDQQEIGDITFWNQSTRKRNN